MHSASYLTAQSSFFILQAFRLALLKLKITPAQLYADKTTLTNILSYHVVNGKALAIADLKDGQQLTTVSKQEITAKVDK